ncbi:MAG TPA: GNAT family N-acetyltransferase [Xanthomonadales bacterium]|nr:GNAT family N-acetyltransferase [Xanthomonadales bacterium]
MSAIEKTRHDFTIRGAEPGDLGAIVEIDQQVSGAKKTRYWRDALELYSSHRDKGFFLVAEREHRVAGFILGEIRAWEFGSPPCGWVYAIGVARANLLEGVGTQLLDALCAHFQKANVDKVRTMIARQDHELLSFFRSYGMMAGPYQQLELELGSH